VTGIEQQRCRNRGIDAARQCDDIARHARQLPGARDDAGST
jgi:hypothetical protein